MLRSSDSHQSHAANDMIELRIELDGVLHKARPALDDDRKWASEARMGQTDFSTIPIVTSAGRPLRPR
jgi:hypothetical protein